MSRATSALALLPWLCLGGCGPPPHADRGIELASDSSASVAFEAIEIPKIADLERLDPRMAETVQGAVAAVERSPHNADLWGRLGRVYHAHRYFELAQRCYRQALALDARSLDWAYLLARLAADRGRNARAIELLEPVVAQDPGDVAAAYHLGSALLTEGRLDEAARVFGALEREPNAGPWGALGAGKVEMRRERWPSALARLAEARRRDPDNREVLYQLATVYRELGQRGEAAALLQQIGGLRLGSPPDPRMALVAAQRRDLQSLILKANLLLEHQRADEAETLYRQVLAYDPDHFDAHYDLGVLLGRTGRVQEALEEMRRAASIRPDNAKVERGLGTAYLELGRPDLALPHLRRAFELDPSDPDLARYLSAAPR